MLFVVEARRFSEMLAAVVEAGNLDKTVRTGVALQLHVEPVAGPSPHTGLLAEEHPPPKEEALFGPAAGQLTFGSIQGLVGAEQYQDIPCLKRHVHRWIIVTPALADQRRNRYALLCHVQLL